MDADNTSLAKMIWDYIILQKNPPSLETFIEFLKGIQVQLTDEDIRNVTVSWNTSRSPNSIFSDKPMTFGSIGSGPFGAIGFMDFYYKNIYPNKELVKFIMSKAQAQAQAQAQAPARAAPARAAPARAAPAAQYEPEASYESARRNARLNQPRLDQERADQEFARRLANEEEDQALAQRFGLEDEIEERKLTRRRLEEDQLRRRRLEEDQAQQRRVAEDHIIYKIILKTMMLNSHAIYNMKMMTLYYHKHQQ